MNASTIPVMDVATPPVCLNIELTLEDANRFKKGEEVVPQSLPNKTATVEEYLKTVMPSARIEHLGRSKLLQLRDECDNFTPTSLFFDTVHHCFKNHYPLALRAEVLMYLIVNEVATTVNLHPSDYRHLFTDSEKKTRIDVRHDGLRKDDPNSPWHQVLEMFNTNLREHIPSELAPSFLPPFSTATQETMAASTVAFMSTVQKFYDFHTHTLCGLPKIHLLGESEDYTKLRAAAEALSKPFENHLGPYFRSLLPVLKTIEEQAQGAPIDKQFWKSLYQFNSDSGRDTFDGWISTFVNYVQTVPGRARENQPAKEGRLEQKSEECFEWSKEPDLGNLSLELGSVPAQISVAPFQWHYFSEEVLPMQFIGGVLGVDDADGYAAPALSYAVAHAA